MQFHKNSISLKQKMNSKILLLIGSTAVVGLYICANFTTPETQTIASTDTQLSPAITVPSSRAASSFHEQSPEIFLDQQSKTARIPDKITASYQVGLIGLLEKYQISLSKTEKTLCQQIYNSIFEARIRHEIEIAKVDAINPNRNRIEIPAYGEWGEQLLSVFRRKITAAIGDQKTERLFSQAATDIMVENANWGREAQILDVTYDEESSLYTIMHGSALIWTQGNDAPVRVSNSKLRPADLDKYTLFKELFPHVPNTPK